LPVSSIVLAGGRGSRLGREKHLEKIAGKSLIERVTSRLSSVSSEIFIVISPRQARTWAPLRSKVKAKIAVDIYPGKGALGGIYTGLVQSDSFHNLVVACDMPFLNGDLLHYMISLTPGFDVVIPRIDNNVEALHAIYSKNCVAPIEEQLKRDNLKIAAFFNSVKVKYVEKEEIERFDPEHLSFFNINTQADLEKARRLALLEETGKRK
jgi:molybdopterin-guanine dinucleotide biosynthesis protein A